ncbi:MAG: 30S ribosomal protein S11 [Nanoarchaeota archaeon]|nr:30S ribosomal protein S11 [Nanoarchaeota archaeon]
MAKGEDNTAILNIYASFNNTIATLTDLAGNTIGRISGGQITKHDRMRANPTIAMFIAKRIQDACRDYRINTLYVRMKGKTGATGVGPGAHAIVRTLTKEGFTILNIAETTAIPRGGPKKKGGRRGRRV